ncbi:hypothetical protein MBANPS3_012550, partial [Mucor bainieri]
MSTPMLQDLQGFDMSQVPQLLAHLQSQLASVQQKVQEHDSLLERLNLLEKENQDLKDNLKAKNLVIQELQGQLSRLPQHPENSMENGISEVSDKVVQPQASAPAPSGAAKSPYLSAAQK